MDVYYLGPEGTFSHQIAKKYFDETYNLIPVANFKNIAEKIKENNALAILPVENSISSNVHQNIDIILQNNLKIIGEVYCRIEFSLVGIKNSKLSDIKKAFAHPMAVLQTKKFIEKNNFEILEASSNVDAQIKLAKENLSDFAAISTNILFDPSLKILQSNIADYKNNQTRFSIVTSEADLYSYPATKLSVLFTTQHQPGALLNVLETLAVNKFNLSKIESRPIPETEFEYMFWIDVELGGKSTIEFEQIFKNKVSSYKLIGAYKKGKLY
mgnify:CR=1 FL=1